WPAKGEGGLSTPVYNAMRNMLLGEYIDAPAPDSGLTVEEHRKIRNGLIETGVLIPLDPNDRRCSSTPANKTGTPNSLVGAIREPPISSPAPLTPVPQPPISSPAPLTPVQPPSVSSPPPKPIAPNHTERPSP